MDPCENGDLKSNTEIALQVLVGSVPVSLRGVFHHGTGHIDIRDEQAYQNVIPDLVKSFKCSLVIDILSNDCKIFKESKMESR